MSEGTSEDPALEAQESLLYSARHGELHVVKSLLEAKAQGKLTLDINCKGKQKSNLGWTALHLATYFGHVEVVRELLQAGADVDEVNEMGDTALHKACYIGNEELVILLLQHNADVQTLNGEGRMPGEVCKTHGARRLVDAAARAETLRGERALLSAAKDGRVEDVQKLLSAPRPPNINCADALGNTPLHCAAYRRRARTAVLLLQNGVDTTLRNHSGQLAIDLAKDEEMASVLAVRPVRRWARAAPRREGPLLRRSRILGWRPLWAVLQRGVLLYYPSRAEAARAGRARGKQYLDGARVTAPAAEPALLVLKFSDGEVHRLCVPRGEDDAAARQSWLTALKEHIAFSGHYLHGAGAGAGADKASEATEDLDDDCKPLGSMQDALTAGENALALLETQLRECAAIVAALDGGRAPAALHHSAYMRFQHALGSGQAALTALRHCAALRAQHSDADRAALADQIERNRVLEESLAALAKTHHALEQSVAEELTWSKRKKAGAPPDKRASQDNFFDVMNDSGSDEDTLVSCSSPLGARSPWGSEPDLAPAPDAADAAASPLTPPSPATARSPPSWCSEQSLCSAASGSLGTLVSTGGHVYRNASRHRLATNYSSNWSL